MSDPILDARTFKVTVHGAEFEMERRSTLIMAKARGFTRVLGVLGGQDAVDDGTVKDINTDETIELVESVLRAALIKPVVVPAGETADPPNSYTMDDIAPFSDILFNKFMDSGLDASPTPSSCEGTTAR